MSKVSKIQKSINGAILKDGKPAKINGKVWIFSKNHKRSDKK